MSSKVTGHSVFSSTPTNDSFGQYRPEIKGVLTNAQKIAREILCKPGQTQPSSSFSSTPSSGLKPSFFTTLLAGMNLGSLFSGGRGSQTTVINNYNGNYNNANSKDPDKDKSKNNLLFYVAFTIVGGVCAFLVGRNWNKSSEAKEELENIKDIQSRYKLKKCGDDETKENINSVLNEHRSILGRVKFKADFHLSLAISVVVFSALAIIGAIFELYVLMYTGLVALPLIGFVFLIKLGMDWSNTKNIRSAKKIDELVSNHL